MSTPVYRFKHGGRLPKGLDAQAIGEELARVRAMTGSGFSPSAVVDVARDESSALHPAIFDCTEEEAAERHWEDQASYVIRHVQVLYVDETQVTRQTNAFVNIVDRETQEPRYLPVFVAMADEEYRTQILGQCLDALLALRHKYAEYKEFARVFAAIDATAKKIRAA